MFGRPMFGPRGGSFGMPLGNRQPASGWTNFGAIGKETLRQPPDAITRDVEAAKASQASQRCLLVGLDIAGVNDWAAFVALERTQEWHESVGRHLNHYTCGLIERWRGLAYDLLVEQFKILIDRLPVPPALVIDATGVGRPIVDMLRRFQVKAEKLVPVVISGGESEKRNKQNYHSVPKHVLVSNLEALVTGQRFKVSPRLPLARQLSTELLHFTRKRSESGHESYEALRESIHDDLCVAAALAAWWGERGQRQLAINSAVK